MVIATKSHVFTSNDTECNTCTYNKSSRVHTQWNMITTEPYYVSHTMPKKNISKKSLPHPKLASKKEN